MKHDCRNKDCGKTTNHISGYCMSHRKEWMQGYKFGLRIRETTGHGLADHILEDLETLASYPPLRGYARVLLRSANLIRSLLKKTPTP